MPRKRHFIGVNYWDTNHIEHFNNNLCQRLARLVRRAFSFTKKLDNHERRLLAQPPLAASGQPYEFTQWQHGLEHYCLLIDVAQDRGTAHDDDWLEMARMIFHTNEGMTGHWLLPR